MPLSFSTASPWLFFTPRTLFASKSYELNAFVLMGLFYIILWHACYLGNGSLTQWQITRAFFRDQKIIHTLGASAVVVHHPFSRFAYSLMAKCLMGCGTVQGMLAVGWKSKFCSVTYMICVLVRISMSVSSWSTKCVHRSCSLFPSVIRMNGHYLCEQPILWSTPGETRHFGKAWIWIPWRLVLFWFPVVGSRLCWVRWYLVSSCFAL